MHVSTLVKEILEAKKDAGKDACLWLHISGDCILWPSEKESYGDDGTNAIARWQVSSEEYKQLIVSGKVGSN